MKDRENGACRLLDRRGFLGVAGGGLTAARLLLGPGETAAAQGLREEEKLDRIASNSYPFRQLFKGRPRTGGGGRRGGGAAAGAPPPAAGAGQSTGTQGRVPGRGMGDLTAEQMKAKYGDITMLDFPQFTKDTFPGVTHMDLFSGLFGDPTDDSMYVGRQFDPSTPSGKKWLERLANVMVKTGVKCQHISNNAPTNLAGPDETQRKEGVAIAKRWPSGEKHIRKTPGILGIRLISEPSAVLRSETSPFHLAPSTQKKLMATICRSRVAAAAESLAPPREVMGFNSTTGVASS